MLNPDVAIPLVVAITATAAMVMSWFRHRERMARIAAQGQRPEGDADRLARVEQAVESIALEVERIGEGQRYLTRLLGEPRAESARVGRAPDAPL